MEEYIISVDWGTSFLRLRLYDQISQTVVANYKSEEGILTTNNAWEQEPAGLNRLEFYQSALSKHVLKLSKSFGGTLNGVPLVISGMASSNIGMQELSYHLLPFTFENPDLLTVIIEANSILSNPILLISGLKDTADVMRGEEIQLLGLSTLINLKSTECSVIILPGTHAKHCFVKSNVMFHFKTYITGELFKLLSENSILKNSVETSKLSESNPIFMNAFKKGVEQSKSGSLMSDLFKVRTNTLLNNYPKELNAHYLSGLLIGNEIIDLSRNTSLNKIVLCCEGTLNELYKIAINEHGLGSLIQEVDKDILSKATLAGHIFCYNKLSKAIDNYA